MKIIIDDHKIMCQNKNNVINGYFAWPSVTKLQDGRLAMVASGFRYAHICPFGKTVICYSEDEGKTWSRPMPIIDTPLDDRDSGICTFGEKGVVVTSFNASCDEQREYVNLTIGVHRKTDDEKAYILSHLKLVDQKCDESKFLGSTFVMSNDGGKTFDDDVRLIPISSPHGPCAIDDNTLLYVGTKVVRDNTDEKKYIAAYILRSDKTFEEIGRIPDCEETDCGCEPYAFIDGNKIIVHIRVSREKFTLYQSESYDMGRTFTQPHQILSDFGGAPAHIFKHSSGALVSVYGVRSKPYGIKAMFSYDGGETWDIDNVIYETESSHDLGYPCSVELSDGSILTVFYARTIDEGTPAVIMQTNWRFEK